MKKLNTILLCLGLTCLVGLIWKIGPRDLWLQLRTLSWGVVPLILSEGLGNLLHTAGWRCCIEGGAKHFSLWRLFRMAMAGFAINYLTPSASLGGEVTKASLLTSGVKGPHAVSSVLMDKLCMGFAHLILVVLGSFLLLWRVHLPMALWLAMAVSSLLLTAGMVIFLLLQKHGKLGAFLRWLVARKVGGATLEKATAKISQVDESLKAFYRERPMGFVLSVAWHVVGHSVAILQAWLFLFMVHKPAGLPAVLAAAFLGLWIDLMTFAVPMNLAALEGSRIVALKAIGFDAALGMTFGIAIRIAQVFWAGFGLVNCGLMTVDVPLFRRRTPVPQPVTAPETNLTE